MASPAKKVKVELKSAVRDGFAQRDWRAVRGDSARFQAPGSVVAPPLSLRVPVVIDSYRYGGATLTGDAVLQCDDVTDVLVGFDRASMPSHFSRHPGDEMTRRSLQLGVETAGGLLDPRGNYHQWVVSELEDLDRVVAEFFAMVDGPLREWAAERDTPDKALAIYVEAAGTGQGRLDSAAVRAASTLALIRDRPDLARTLIAGYVPGLGDDPERIALFERLLAERYPAYGAPQLG